MGWLGARAKGFAGLIGAGAKPAVLLVLAVLPYPLRPYPAKTEDTCSSSITLVEAMCCSTWVCTARACGGGGCSGRGASTQFGARCMGMWGVCCTAATSVNGCELCC